MTADDRGHEIRVRVSFTDDEGFSESRTSLSAQAPAAACSSANEEGLRLVGGDTAREGEVEICHDNQWGNVCDDHWAKVDADVACKQLGYTQGAQRATIGGEFVTLIAVKYWLDDVACTGSETKLADCGHAGWGVENCTHAERAGVVCKRNTNVAATGQPDIAGIPQVGETLTATIGDIADENGLASFPSGFGIQWVRVDGTTETDISGATSRTYVPRAADLGKRLKVRVSFTDGDGYAEGPLESDAVVVFETGSCISDADWCTLMTVGKNGTIYGFWPVNSNPGALGDTTVEFGGGTWTVSRIDLDDTADTVGIGFDQYLPSGTTVTFDETEFTADASSKETTTGRHEWAAPAGFVWGDRQQVVVSLRFPRSVVSIQAITPEVVHGAETIQFGLFRDNTEGPLNVDVVLTDERGHLAASARSRTITFQDGSAGAGLYIPREDFKDLDDGGWLLRPGSIRASIVERPWYRLARPSSASVTMNYAMTVGFGPHASSFRVDEGSGTVDVQLLRDIRPGAGRADGTPGSAVQHRRRHRDRGPTATTRPGRGASSSSPGTSNTSSTMTGTWRRRPGRIPSSRTATKKATRRSC